MREFDRHYLLKLRNERGFSHEVLARMIGMKLGGTMTRASISHWEQGISKPSLDSLLALGEIFERPLDYFFTPYQNYLFVLSGRDEMKQVNQEISPGDDAGNQPRKKSGAVRTARRERPVTSRIERDAPGPLEAGEVR